MRTNSSFGPLQLAALAGLGLAVGGCSVARPSAGVAGIREVDRQGDVARVQLMLELANEGSDEVQLLEYEYVVSLSDGSKYSGRWAALRALPPSRRISAEVPAVLPTAAVDGGASWTVRGVMRYRDPQSIARILYESGLLKTEVEFTAEGPAIAKPGA